MSLVLTSDFNTHIYSETISSIDRDTDGLLQKAIDSAEAIVKGYLSRFNITTLFSQSGSNRNEELLSTIKDVALWHFCKLSSPNMNLDMIKECHDDAIKWLKDIQAGRVDPYQWPEATDSDGDVLTSFKVDSAVRRKTHW